MLWNLPKEFQGKVERLLMIKMKMTMEKSKKNEKLKQKKMMKSWENQAAHKSAAIVEL